MRAHLVNCTYCENRLVTPGDKKRSLPEIERCSLTMLPIKPPTGAGRWCDQFHQIGHTCGKCCNS